MKEKSVEKVVGDGVRFLSKIFPQKTYLYFPLLSAALVWAVRRTKEWKEKIFSWKIWPDPDLVKVKPDEFIINFYKSNPDLCRAYRDEIEKKDLKTLREAFRCLYPILGLEDPFLFALFQKELESNEYNKIVDEFDAKVSLARNDIDAAEGKARLLEGLKTFAEEIVSFGTDLLSQANAQKAIAELIEKQIKKKNE